MRRSATDSGTFPPRKVPRKFSSRASAFSLCSGCSLTRSSGPSNEQNKAESSPVPRLADLGLTGFLIGAEACKIRSGSTLANTPPPAPWLVTAPQNNAAIAGCTNSSFAIATCSCSSHAMKAAPSQIRLCAFASVMASCLCPTASSAAILCRAQSNFTASLPTLPRSTVNACAVPSGRQPVTCSGPSEVPRKATVTTSRAWRSGNAPSPVSHEPSTASWLSTGRRNRSPSAETVPAMSSSGVCSQQPPRC